MANITVAANERHHTGPRTDIARMPTHLSRALDVVEATIALVIALPMLAAAALAIRLSSRGPVIFRQVRVGRNGRLFEVLKFRTMHVDADPEVHRRFVTSMQSSEFSDDRTFYKLVADTRVTRVGRLLRRLSIDELPQLLNVLRGDMRLVGPRPALPYEVARYDRWQRRRLAVRPGITGLWQVSGRSKLSYTEMLALDVRYVETRSLRQDLAIVVRTIPALLRREAA